MKQFNIAIARDAAKIIFTYKKRNPSSGTGDYFDSASITAASVKVINTETDATILASTAMSFSSTIRGYRYIWTYGSALDGITAITVEVTPTRAVGVSATLTPIDSEEFEVADILQRIDESTAANAPANVADAVWDEATAGHTTVSTFGKLAEDTKTDVDALQTDFNAFEVTNQGEHDATQTAVASVQTSVDSLQTDFNSFETVNQGEHDATQSALAQIGATARTQLMGPTTFLIPDSGTSTFVLDWTGKDTDASPTILDDPDSNIVDVTVVDQTGSAPTGVSLGGSPAGRMTRNSLGRFQLEVEVDDAAVEGTQLRFTAASMEDGAADVAIWTMTLGDFDQLDDISAQVNAIRTVDVPAIVAEVDTRESEASASTRAAADLAAHATTKAVADAIRDTDIPAVNANVDAAESSINANVDAEHIATRALISSETAAIDSDLSDIKGSGFSTGADSLKAVSDAADTANAALVALQAALANFEATVKTKTGGTYDRDTDSLEALHDAIAAVSASVQQRLKVRLVS